MDKYYKDELDADNSESRLVKNQNKYNNFDTTELENLDLTTNISVIDTDIEKLDIDELKDYLNDHYSKDDISDVYNNDLIEEEDKLVDTKEYDLKKVLEKAHNNKESNYDEDRFKKLRDTQYDILKDLDLNRKEDPKAEETLSTEEATLINLIKTVEGNAIKKEGETKELMSDLIGDDNTEVLPPVDENMEYTSTRTSLADELEKTLNISKKEITNAIENDTYSEPEEEPSKTSTMELTDTTNTFYTGQYKIKNSDLDDGDYQEFEGSMKIGNILIKITVAIIVVIVLVIVLYFVDKYFGLGLFK